MSGGPVVDLGGNVVGVVSRSLAPADGHPGVGWAVDLTQVPQTFFAPELDPNNPGCSLGWGVFSGGAMIGFCATEEKAVALATATQADEIKYVTHSPKSDSWIEI